ncbi:MAG: CotS family spore coat protein [Carboxydocellales bacterium]
MGGRNGDLRVDLNKMGLDPEILQQYPFEVQGVKQLRKSVFQLVTNSGVKALKGVQYPIGELLFMFSAMEHLLSRGFSKLARIVRTKAGLPFVPQGGSYYFVTEWISGRESDYDLERDLQATVKTMAELHQASRGLQLLPGSYLKTELGRWPENFHRRGEQLLEFAWEAKRKREKTIFDWMYLTAIDEFYQEAQVAQSALAGTAYWELVRLAQQECGFCHHDFAYHNVIIQNGQGFLIDFDYCLCDMRIHDLTSLLIRNMKKHNWDIFVAEKIINFYHQHYPLAPQEFPVMLAFMKFPQDFWQAAWTYYREDIGRTEKESVSRLERAIKLNHERQSFLTAFASLV